MVVRVGPIMAMPVLSAPTTPQLQDQDFHNYDSHCLELRSSEVVVSFAESPNDFFVQICEPTIVQKFREMSVQLNAEMMPSDQNSTIPTMSAGSPVAAFFVGNWYRGKIVNNHNSPQEVSVQFVDFGSTETLPLDKVKPLDAKFLQLPPVAIHCTLKDARPLQSASWPILSCDFMESLIEKTPGPLCIFFRFDQDHMIFEVDLVNHQSQPLGSVLDYLIKSGWAAPVLGSGLLQLPTPTTVPIPAAVVPIPTASEASARPIFPRMNPFLSGHHEALVQTSFAISPVDFHLHVMSIHEHLENVMLSCRAAYINTGDAISCPGPLPAPVATGQHSVARFAEDGDWYRAETLQDRGAEGISVYFVDFGNVSVCAREDVRYVAADAVLLTTPALAVPCCIQGLSESNVSVTSFDEEGRNEFEKLVDGSECIFLGWSESGRYEVILNKTGVDFLEMYLKRTAAAADASGTMEDGRSYAIFLERALKNTLTHSLDTFACKICLSIICPPACLCTRCNQIIGCEVCVKPLLFSNRAICPLCRQHWSKGVVQEVKGLDDFLANLRLHDQ